MIDIDFRYVMREDIYSDEWRKPMIKVLQWRKKVLVDKFKDTENSFWTDWQDVRTEEE